MSKGLVKRVANTDARFGSAPEYLFVKVQADWSADEEEFLLMTDHEYAEAVDRASRNPEDVPRLTRGVYAVVENALRRFGEDTFYIAVHVRSEGGDDVALMFTDEALNRVRERVAANREDVDANKPGWLADLFD